MEWKNMIGKTISHYKILEKLGAGGMGVVYKARDLRLDRFVALKFLPSHLGQEKDEKKRFIHEAKATSALDHPNICNIHEIDETEDGQMFIAMACYEGESLQVKIERGPMPADEAIDIVIQAARGLAAAHQRGIYHRDLKPANVMLTGCGEVKIVDFGLAKLAGESKLTKAGTTLGTAAYMSPEQAQGAGADHRTDIWSLGVVLYEMLTGERPFKGDYEQAVVYSIINEEPPSIAELKNRFSPEVAHVIERVLQKQPDDRHQTMEDLLMALQSVRSDLEAAKIMDDAEKTIPSIAVLPFVNMSADPENEYFSDGLAEDLINALTKIKDFRVAARTSAFSFKGEKIDVREIGRKLNVQTVLEGSVRKSGKRLRVTAQLINVDDGYHLWSEQYDRVMADIFDIQDEITLAIVDSLKVELLAREKRAVMKRHTYEVDQYHLYLKGRYYWNKGTTGGSNKAVEHFQAAIAKDPTYGLAYAGLADAYASLGDAGHAAIPPKEAFSKAMEAVHTALEIDQSLAEAHTSLGHLKMHDFDWSGAEREYKRALELNPNYAYTHHLYAHFSALKGEHQEAIISMKHALELDPVSLGTITDLGVLLYYDRQYDEAIAQYQRTLDMDPGYVRAYITLSSAYGQKGMIDEAIAMARKALDLSKDRAKMAVLGRAYALSGEKAKALKIIEDLKSLSKKRYISPYMIVLIYASLNDKDPALDWLQQAYEERVGDLIYLKVDPFLDNLRSDPRFAGLLKKVGLES
jgi:serine/threonine-protein kinase